MDLDTVVPTQDRARQRFYDNLLARTPANAWYTVFETLQRAEMRTAVEREAEEEARMIREQAAAIKQNRERIRKSSGLMGMQWAQRFDTFVLAGSHEDKNNQAEVLRATRAFADNFPNVERGFMLVGRPGVGKDFYLNCIANHLLDRPNPPTLYKRYSSDLEKMFFDQWFGDKKRDEKGDFREELYGKEPPSDLEVFLKTRDLLLIGDLHKVLGSNSRGVVEAMIRVLKHASDTGKPKLCISSMIPLYHGQVLDGVTMDYYHLYGEAITSWLQGLMDVINLTGPDRRQRAA